MLCPFCHSRGEGNLFFVQEIYLWVFSSQRIFFGLYRKVIVPNLEQRFHGLFLAGDLSGAFFLLTGKVIQKSVRKIQFFIDTYQEAFTLAFVIWRILTVLILH